MESTVISTSDSDSNITSEGSDTANIDKSNLLEYALPKIDAFLTENNIPPITRRKFKETEKIHGIVFKFSHFGVEVVKDQVTIFGKYISKFYDVESYENNDKLLEALLPRIQEFHLNPVLTKHPFIRFFHRLKNRNKKNQSK